MSHVMRSINVRYLLTYLLLVPNAIMNSKFVLSRLALVVAEERCGAHG